MIYKRVAARLRAQDWLAIMIELTIVIVGVFIGSWVNDWNQRRAEKQEIGRLLTQLQPEVVRLERIAVSMRNYYAVTDRFAKVALAGWNDDSSVSDRDFVIAAYQASQINWIPDGESLSELLGGDQVRKIEDARLRVAIIRLLNYDFSPLSQAAVATRYRDDVRQIIPELIQESIRSECGDIVDGNTAIHLPDRCDIDLQGDQVHDAVVALRAHSNLPGELRQHQSKIAAFLTNLRLLEKNTRDVERLNR